MNAKRFRIPLALVTTFLSVAGALALVWALSGDPQTAHAQGTIRYVAPGGDCGTASPCYSTVQEAVDAAQAGDEIRVAAGTYAGINNYGGLAQVIYITKSLTIQGGYTTDNWGTPDPEANLTELNAMALGRVMVISGTADVTVEGLHLTYGNAADLGNGGGIYVLEANVTLKHTWVLSNSTPSGSSGGGLYLRNASAILDDDTFHGNYAGYGGAFCLYQSDLTMNDSVIRNNKTYYRGGGLYVNEHSNATLRDNVIQDNSSGVGGGARLYRYSSATFISNLIQNNSATVFDGGGVQIQWVCSATFISNTIRGNSASAGGGGVTVWQSDATFSGNTIEDNTTGGSGGGILGYVSNDVILSNNIIQNNKAYGGGGVALVNSGGPITLTGNIIQDNVSRGASYVHHKNGGGVSVGNSNAAFIGNIVRRNNAEKNFLGGGGGGGIAVHGGNVILINNIVVDNQATTTGSGIQVVASSPELYHTTIVSNTGGDGSGIFIGESGDEPGHATLYNSIIANQAVGVKVSSNLALNTATLDGVLWWGNASNITGTVFPFDEFAGTPAFVDPSAGDYHIGLGSAAVDVGIDDAGITDDIDSQTRPHYEGYDLGADEWWPLVAVKTATPDTVEPGDVVTYTLTLTNATDAAMTVCLTDTLPTQVSYLGPLAYNNGSGGYASSVVTWTGTVLTATSTLITWPVQVAPDVLYSTTITNTAAVSDAYGLFQTDPALILVPPRHIYLPLVLRNYQ